MKPFVNVEPVKLPGNPIERIGTDWMLITAGTPDRFNTMTASWGSMGVMWFKPVCFCFIRPQRYTFEFMEQHESFTLSFFSGDYRPQLNLCGSRSGREIDKVAECGFTPRAAENGSVFFDEARLVIECRKMYVQDIDPKGFLNPAIAECYPNNDYHRMYIGEITRTAVEKEYLESLKCSVNS
ncbi:MAG: flavin reductase family protein [Pontiellaceae bacterium]|nr:flavin reductase family protein [Pontiellaceae bacterium]